MMYWMRGEKIAARVTAEELDRFLQIGNDGVRAALAELVEKGLIRASIGTPVAYELSDVGVEEGKRRFVEEFSGVLGHESHIECDRPDCECHDPGFDGSCFFA